LRLQLHPNEFFRRLAIAEIVKAWKLNFRDAVFIADSPHISPESAGIRKSLLLELSEPARGPKPHGII
jgi:hypothetical protein